MADQRKLGCPPTLCVQYTVGLQFTQRLLLEATCQCLDVVDGTTTDALRALEALQGAVSQRLQQCSDSNDVPMFRELLVDATIMVRSGPMALGTRFIDLMLQGTCHLAPSAGNDPPFYDAVEVQPAIAFPNLSRVVERMIWCIIREDAVGISRCTMVKVMVATSFHSANAITMCSLSHIFCR